MPQGMNWAEQPDGTILYRPSPKLPTYVLTKEQHSKINSTMFWQLILAIIAALPVILAIISWLDGTPSKVLILWAVISVAVVTPIGLALDRRTKKLLKQAKFSEIEWKYPAGKEIFKSLIRARHDKTS
ncbi:MAG: hypothetical protein JNK47_17045 [Mesorhizobium sp.]|nr:hypothetical protein [Mesorhizobium sp.]MBL8578929.1 hypothetical protein [Mesorhizobium sp.]